MALIRHLGLSVLLLLVAVHGRLSAQSPAGRTVVLTFDDLPGPAKFHCDAGPLLNVSRGIIAALLEVKAPSAAFVTTGNVCEQLRDSVLGEVVRIWQRAGAVIGNHGHRHGDLSTVPLGQYLADVGLADSLLRRSGHVTPSFFRHPFLHAGPDTARANGLSRWLEQHGYTVAPVTIDNNEWIYARAYSQALTRGDSAMVGRLVPAYLEHIDQAFAFSESMSVRVVGEEVPQILLLHANELNRDHIRDVLAVIQRRGYHYISLEAALRHPAFRRPSYYLGPWGISWLLRWSPDSTVWRMDMPAVPAWVGRYSN